LPKGSLLSSIIGIWHGLIKKSIASI
jgi:hypothetical protein